MSESCEINWIDWLVAHRVSKAHKLHKLSIATVGVGIDISTYTFQNLYVCMPKVGSHWHLHGEQNGVGVSWSGLLPS